MSNVTPESTTAALAANVPKESARGQATETTSSDKAVSSDVPGSFPETPFHDASEFVVDPIPATSGIGNPVHLEPGESVPHPNTLTSNTVSSTVKDDPSLKKSAEDSEQTFGVAPIPATAGIGNPVSLQPGEKVPHPSTLTDNTINSTVTTDKASYENSTGAPQIPDFIGKDNEANGGMFNLPGITKNMIPESSLPMGEAARSGSEPDPGFTIQSAGPNSTTAALAGQVPLEPRGVPQVVSDSQHEASVDPEATANPEAVQEKSEVEKELESKVPEEPATSEGTAGGKAGEVAGMAVGGAAIGGAAAAAASHGLPDSVQKSIDEMNKGSAIAPTVPDVVQESIAESHQSPEAAADKTMVEEKREMEQQLLKKVPKEEDVGEPAPSSTAALAETAPAPTGAEKPPPVTNGPAPMTTATAPAQTLTTGNAMKQAVQNQPDSRDISPMSKPVNTTQTQAQPQPSVTTGVGASSAPTTSRPSPQTPDKAPAAAKESPASTSTASASTDKKSKRASGFFGKLKAKFSDKDKK